MIELLKYGDTFYYIDHQSKEYIITKNKMYLKFKSYQMSDIKSVNMLIDMLKSLKYKHLKTID